MAALVLLDSVRSMLMEERGRVSGLAGNRYVGGCWFIQFPLVLGCPSYFLSEQAREETNFLAKLRRW